LGRRDMVVYQ